MCSFDFDELEMDTRRSYLMRDLKRSKKKHKSNKYKDKIKHQNKKDDIAKFDIELADNWKSKRDEPGGSNDITWNYNVEGLYGNSSNKQDSDSLAKLCDFQNGIYGLSNSNSKEESEDVHVSASKDDDLLALDNDDALQNTMGQMKTLKNQTQKSRCSKRKRVSFSTIFKRYRKKCVKKEKSENDFEGEAIASTSGFKSQRRQLKDDESDNEEADGKNNESKYESKRKQSEINKSDVSKEEKKIAESKHKSRRKTSEINVSDVCEEEEEIAKSNDKSRKKQSEIVESDPKIKHKKETKSKYKLQEKQLKKSEISESDVSDEAEEIDESKDKSRKKQSTDNENVESKSTIHEFSSKGKFDKSKRRKRKSETSSNSDHYLTKKKRKRSKSNSSSKSRGPLPKSSSSAKFDNAKKINKIKNQECKCPNSASKLSLDVKASKEKERVQKSASKKLLKSQKKKKIRWARGKFLKKGREKTCPRPKSSRKKLSDSYREKKKPRGKEKSVSVRTSKKSSVSITGSLSRRRRSSRAPTLENFGKELKKMNGALLKKIQQKELQLLGSRKEGKGKKKVQSKHEHPQIINCRCASSDLKDRYTKLMEDYHRLKRQYEELKCVNAVIEKKLRYFTKKIRK